MFPGKHNDFIFYTCLSGSSLEDIVWAPSCATVACLTPDQKVGCSNHVLPFIQDCQNSFLLETHFSCDPLLTLAIDDHRFDVWKGPHSGLVAQRYWV